MAGLADERCVELNSQAVGLTAAAAGELKLQLPDWTLINDGMDKLERAFIFVNFADAMAFASKVGEAAEAQGHHPELTTTWGRTTLRWWTHVVRGLHRNDFIMAAKTDALAS